MRKHIKTALCLLGQILPAGDCSPLFAAQTPPAPDLFWMSVRMFSVLAVILGIVLLLYFVFKKLNLPGRGFLGANRCMQMVETLYVGPRKSIALVRAGEEFVLVGLSANQITYLTKIDLPSEFRNPEGGSGKNDFSRILRGIQERSAGGGNTSFSLATACGKLGVLLKNAGSQHLPSRREEAL